MPTELGAVERGEKILQQQLHPQREERAKMHLEVKSYRQRIVFEVEEELVLFVELEPKQQVIVLRFPRISRAQIPLTLHSRVQTHRAPHQEAQGIESLVQWVRQRAQCLALGNEPIQSRPTVEL